MTPEYKSLLMRCNRLLGTALVEQNLVKLDDLEKANERLLEVIAAKQTRQSTILGVLAYEMKVVKEDDILHHAVETDGIGLVDLRSYEVSEEVRKACDVAACWATWTVPFDHEEEFHSLASAHYLSPAVRSFWEKQLGNQIVWYGTTLDVLADYLEKLDAEQAKPAAPSGTRSPFAPPAAGTPPAKSAPAA
jgi:hypothetical protein